MILNTVLERGPGVRALTSGVPQQLEQTQRVGMESAPINKMLYD
jgi:hypothetical protein